MTTINDYYKVEHANNIALFNLKPVPDHELEDFATSHGLIDVPEAAAVRDLGDRTIISTAYCDDMLARTTLSIYGEGMKLFGERVEPSAAAFCRLAIDATG